MSALLAAAPAIENALSGPPARSWLVVARAVDYVGTALFVGGTAFLALLWPGGTQDVRARGVLAFGLVLGLFGTFFAIVLQGAWIGDIAVSEAMRWEVARSVLDTTFGQVWAAKALLWVLATVVMADLFTRGEQAAQSVAWRVGALVVCGGLLRALGMSGHSAEQPDALVLGIADFVHLTGISLWVGGLAVLLLGVLPRRRPEELASVVPRYSKLAFGSVMAIVAGGTVLSWGLIGSWANLVGTGYGQLLILKIGIFALVLVAAMASKTWVSRRLDIAVTLRGHVAAVRPFVYSVATETVLVLFVLLAASFLVTASPGR
ncbi:MAG: copper resistance D family protein [Pseudonocardiaceae bacterium]